MSSPRNGLPTGLRERKKALTRAAIQDHALRLYLKQGYAATTVEQIAEAAGVSQSTFFRYFPTKSETVLFDRFDPIIMESFLNQPPELAPLAAVRKTFQEVVGELSPEQLQLEGTRWRLVAHEPELRSVIADSIAVNAAMFAEAVAQRVGREPNDFAVRTWVGALIGVVFATFIAVVEESEADVVASVDAAIAQLEAGLPL